MEKLFELYSFNDIIIFILLAAITIKGVIELIDWFSSRSKNKYKKETEKDNEIDSLNKDIQCCQLQIQEIKSQQAENLKTFAEAMKKIDLLIESDKDSIKTIITDKYHYYIKQEWIDNYSMECLEKMFEHYEAEGGNSFIHNLMEDIRKLPREPKE